MAQFEVLFESTPGDLIVDGLYKALALASHPGAFWPVTVALVAKALGATHARGRRIKGVFEPAQRVERPSSSSKPSKPSIPAHKLPPGQLARHSAILRKVELAKAAERRKRWGEMKAMGLAAAGFSAQGSKKAPEVVTL